MRRGKISALEMEVLVGRWFSPRRNLVVPNVSWGLGLHECDLLVMTRAGYLWECEIKVSKSDLKKDRSKWHQHKNPNIRKLYFAIPTYLQDCIELVPEHAGLITVAPKTEFYQHWRVRKIRDAAVNPRAGKHGHDVRYTLARLGALRIFGLKAKLLEARA